MQIRQIFFNPITAVFITILCFLFILSLQATTNATKKQFIKYQNQEEIVKQKEDEVQKLQAEMTELDNPFYQEKVLRDELLLQKEGEKIIQLPTLPKTNTRQLPPLVPMTPWDEWQQLIFK